MDRKYFSVLPFRCSALSTKENYLHLGMAMVKLLILFWYFYVNVIASQDTTGLVNMFPCSTTAYLTYCCLKEFAGAICVRSLRNH